MSLQPTICIWIIGILATLEINGCQQHKDLKEIKQEIVKLQEVRK